MSHDDDVARWVRTPTAALGLSDRPLVGEKGLNLARLQSHGQAVPPWYAITPGALRDALDAADLTTPIEEALAPLIARRPGQLPPSSASDASNSFDLTLEAVTVRVAHLLRQLAVPAAIERAIAAVHSRHIPAAAFCAVRASVADGGAGSHAVAGLADAALYVQGHAAIGEAVRGHWLRAYSAAALRHRHRSGLPLHPPAIAMVVQQMVDAASSGVLHTAHPESGDVRTLLACARFGVCGNDDDAAIAPRDVYEIDKTSRTLRQTVVEKPAQLGLDLVAGGVHRLPVPVRRRHTPSLGDDQVRAVVRAGLDIERAYGQPQTIVFCIDPEGWLSVLRTRPAPSAAHVRGWIAGPAQRWLRAGWAERTPGDIAPLAFSLLRRTTAASAD
ncbi:MAG: PEP/pyruvate-binding domain-containing protein, partial [Acidobacteriota bacterium]